MVDDVLKLFLFKGGRRARLEAVDRGEAPSDFMYGFWELRSSGANVALLEQDELPAGQALPRLWSRLWLRFVEWALRKWYGMAFPGERYAAALHELNRYHTIVATPDSIGLTLGYLRYRGWLKARVIVICMATSMKLDAIRRRGTPGYGLVRRFVAHALAGCDRKLALGEGEVRGLNSEFGAVPGLSLLPFGIDCRFWHTGDGARSEVPQVLFVGNDLNRDFGLLIAIARAMPEVKFCAVTAGLPRGAGPANLEVISSDWYANTVSDKRLREMYRNASVVALPLLDTRQPSGQSVCLQAMACGAPVVISRTRGFWDTERFHGGEHCLFVEQPDVHAWVAALRKLLEDRELREALSRQGRALVIERYDIRSYAQAVGRELTALQGGESAPAP